MNCPQCGHPSSEIVDTEDTSTGVQRRRHCEGCDRHFSTHERVQQTVTVVIKRDGRREDFEREKLLRGLRVCARKRPLPADAVEAIVDDIEQRLVVSGRSEVPSRVIGEMAITHLRRLDPIAYIRFASAYRQFVSLDDMLSDLASLAHNPLPSAEQPRLFADDFDHLLAGGDEPPGGDGLSPAPTPIGSARSASHA